MKKRILSALLSAAMAATMLPSVLAENVSADITVVQSVAGEDAAQEFKSTRKSVYAVNVTYTANTTQTPQDTAQTMTININGKNYVETLALLEADVQETVTVYSKFNPGTNAVEVYGNANYIVDSIEAVSMEVCTFEAETDATGGSISTVGDTESGTIQGRSGPATIEYTFEYPAGNYNITLNAASKYVKGTTLYINGEAKNTINVSAKNWGSYAVSSFYDIDFGNYDFTEDTNTVTFVIEDNIIVNSITLTDNDAKTVCFISSASPLRLEAETYMYETTGWNPKHTFADDADNQYIISKGMKADFYVNEAGTYILNVNMAAKYSSAVAQIEVNGTAVYNGQPASVKEIIVTDTTATTDFAITSVDVTLVEGINTVEIPTVSNLAIDYAEISSDVNYSEEIYSYELQDKNIRSGRRWAMAGTYLGAHDTSSEDWENTKQYASTKALTYNSVSHVYYPFTTRVSGEYYLKVTYSSSTASKAVVFVDPVVSADNFPQWAYCTYGSFGGTKIESGTWQETYSYSASIFEAPYFTEKYIKLGKISAGEHNFAFVVDPDSTENAGVAIRKVELLSSDKVEEGLYITEAQMIAENIQAEEASVAQLVTEPEEANVFSANSSSDDDKNTAAVVGYAFNNSSESKNISLIAASYDENGVLIGVDLSGSYTLAVGEDINLKTKVSTEAATAVRAYFWDLAKLSAINGGKLFGK